MGAWHRLSFKARGGGTTLPQTAGGDPGDATHLYERAVDYERGSGGVHEDPNEALRLHRLAADGVILRRRRHWGSFTRTGWAAYPRTSARRHVFIGSRPMQVSQRRRLPSRG